MTARMGILLALVAKSLCAQFQLYVVQGSAEQLVGAQYDIGTVPAGGSRDTTFHLRNSTQAPATLTILSVEGAGFSTVDPPSLPQTVPAGNAVEFTVRFTPTGSGFFSSLLTADGVSAILLGTQAAATARGTVYLEKPDGGRALLHAGDTVDFGSIPTGGSVERDFDVVNETGAPLTVVNVALSGSYFRLNNAGLLPATLAPGGFITIRVMFEPRQPGPRKATVRIEKQDFFLEGEGVDAFPQPQLSVDPPSLHSAQQGRLAIQLPSPSPVSGEGTVTMTFRPSITGVIDDPGAIFLLPSNPRDARTVIFTVTQGDTKGRFNGASRDEYAAFQTGTTAGEVVFTGTLPGWTGQKSLTIPRSAIGVDTAIARRVSPGLNVSINGFDNTRTASQFTFTFFDGAGKAVPPGAMQVNLTEDFRSYFATSQDGGVFGLRAVFPVTGDAMQIDAVSVELVNAAGTVRVQRLRFTGP